MRYEVQKANVELYLGKMNPWTAPTWCHADGCEGERAAQILGLRYCDQQDLHWSCNILEPPGAPPAASPQAWDKVVLGNANPDF